MMDAQGNDVHFDTHGSMMGGEWAAAGMMMGGSGQFPEMGDGWQGSISMYGMVFTFTTAP
jgi:hypothetical protein